MGSSLEATSYDDEILELGNRLLDEYADVPIVIVLQALHEACRMTEEWLQRLDPAAVYDLAAWHLRERSLPC